MSNLLKVKCPNCQATLQVNSEMRGKQMGCPKCQARFRLPEPKNTAELPPMAIPVSPTTAPGPVWDNQDVFQSAQIPAQQNPASFASQPHTQYPQQGNFQQFPTYAAPKQAQGHVRGGGKSSGPEPELTEKESSLQASAIFLLFVPLIVTVLPLFGLQLKRLAGFGEYAPLAAMFLSLVGSGIIVWARRKRSDVAVMGAIAITMSLVTGIGGFFVLKQWEGGGEVQQADNDRQQLQPNNNQPIPNTGSMPNSPPPAKLRRPLEQDGRLVGDLMSKQAEGSFQYARLTSRGGDEPAVYNQVGKKDFSAALYADRPVIGVCGFSLGTLGLSLVPIESVSPGLKYAVMPNGDEVLHGLRFAFNGEQIVGFQGLLRPKNSTSVRETEWFGERTDVVKESISVKPGNAGIICYQNGPQLTGFGWVEL